MIPVDKLIASIEENFADGCPHCGVKCVRRVESAPEDSMAVHVRCLRCNKTFVFRYHPQEQADGRAFSVGLGIAARAAIL